jgi:hypothetical protein
VAGRTYDVLPQGEFEEARACLFGAGVPGEFLPTAGDLGRTDLA